MFKKKLLLVLSTVALLVLAACTGGGTGGGKLKLGFIAPLTGDVASIGQMEKNSVQLYLDQHPEFAENVEIVWEDGQCNGQFAANAAQKLVNVDSVSVILGGACSGETLSILPIAEAGGVLVFSSTSTSPELTGASQYFFRNAPSDAMGSTVLADKVAADGHESVAVFSQLNDFAQAYSDATLPKLEAHEVEVAVNESYNDGTTDFKTLLEKVDASGVEALIALTGDSSSAGFIAKQTKELGLDLQIYGVDTASGSEFFEIAGDATEGTIIVMGVADKGRAEVQAFLDDYEAAYGEAPPAEVYGLANFDKVGILHEAYDKLGGFDDIDALRGHLRAMSAYDGLAGSTSFDENGDSSLLPSLLVAEDGDFVLLK